MLQRWRNIVILNDTVTRSTRLAAAATHLASFHSTSAFLEKRKNNFSSGVSRDQEPSKTHIRYTVREKRADPKKALKDILYNGGSSQHGIAAGYSVQLKKKSRIKPAHHSKWALERKLKRKHRRENPYDDYDDNPARAYFAAFRKAGSNSNFRRGEQRSEWMENSDSTNSRFNVPDAKSITCADRRILGLPATGPLKIEDVKTAFRSSALKWHPDRHQHSARAAAEEQFKHCVASYKSLCASVSSG